MFLWYKAFHIISLVAWFAGLFYLPRLFVYHTASDIDPAGYARFCVMEQRLYRIIMTPAAILTFIFGLSMMHTMGMGAYQGAGWFHVKLSLVMLLVFYHLYNGVCVKRFARHDNRHSARFYRFWNEIPSLLLVSIVILVVVRPF